jgi:hypothetical protein
MSADHKMTGPISSARRQARWLRITAAVVLLLGIFGADLIYWLRTRSVDSPNPLPIAGEDKAATRQAETLFGQQTVLLDEWGRTLKRPGTQALMIVVTAALAAGGCFYFARLLDHAEEQPDETKLPQG